VFLNAVKKLRILKNEEDLSVSEEGICSMELIS
jgi:hypothetical protein